MTIWWSNMNMYSCSHIPPLSFVRVPVNLFDLVLNLRSGYLGNIIVSFSIIGSEVDKLSNKSSNKIWALFVIIDAR